jgi:hypothetical protein
MPSVAALRRSGGDRSRRAVRLHGLLGVASLIGVIVSHVIVLFDFVEEMQAEGEPLREAVPVFDTAEIHARAAARVAVGAVIWGHTFDLPSAPEPPTSRRRADTEPSIPSMFGRAILYTSAVPGRALPCYAQIEV